MTMRLFAASVSLLTLATAASAQQAGPLSQMPFASTPFDGTELLYLAQHGNSFKTTLGSIFGQFTPAGVTIINPGPSVQDMSIPINAAFKAGASEVWLACGNFYINASIYMPSYTRLTGSGPCTSIITTATIAANPQWANVNANPTFATAISNADMLNGNSNLDISELKIDISTPATRFVWGIGFGTASVYNVWNTSIIGRGDTHASGQDGIANLNSHDGHIYSDYIYGMGNGSIDIFQGSHDIKIDHVTVDTNSTGFGVTANGSGKNSSGTIIPTPVYAITIDHSTFRNTLNGLTLTGLCTNTTGVCGTNYSFIVDGDIIDNVTQFHGILFGDSSNYIVANNKISNTHQACILEQSAIAGGGGVTSGGLISANQCSNIKLSTDSKDANISAISIGNGSDVPTNTTIVNNEVVSATPHASAVTFPFAVAVDAQVVGNTLTGTFAGVLVPNVGQILTGAGITGSPTIIAANGTPPTSWTISGPSQGTVGPETMSVSGQIVTSLSLNTGGYCTTQPTVVFSGGGGTGASATAALANGTTGGVIALALTSGGSGYTSPPTISFANCNPPQYAYATRVLPGSINTSFSAGSEEPGSLGTDLIQGSTAPVTAYGSWNFLSEATFSDPAVGINIANTDATKRAQIRFTAFGASRAYQLGEGGGSETDFGVASCEFLFDTNGSTVIWKVCPGDAFSVQTSLAIPSIPTSAGSGGLYVCIDSAGATYKKASCP